MLGRRTFVAFVLFSVISAGADAEPAGWQQAAATCRVLPWAKGIGRQSGELPHGLPRTKYGYPKSRILIFCYSSNPIALPLLSK